MALGDPQRKSFKFLLEELFDGNYLHCREYLRLRQRAVFYLGDDEGLEDYTK